MFDIKDILNRNDKNIFAKEFQDWLPEKIFDAHAHICNEDNFQKGYEFPEKSFFHKFSGKLTMEDYFALMNLLMPERDVSTLCFGFPDKQTNCRGADDYIGQFVDNKKIFGLAMLSPKRDFKELEHSLSSNKLCGYKPYRDFVDWMDYEEVTIFDMLPEEYMVYADENELIVLLHIPKAKRLEDPVNQKQMVEICRKYPNAKIIFAHVGRAYYMKGVVGLLEGIADCDNAYIDIAMVSHPGVIEYALNNFPRKKILYGSDAPIAFLRGKSVEINNQYAYLMGEDYRIGAAIYDQEHIVNYTTFFYEELRGIKEACEKAKLSSHEIEDLFYNNAFRILN